MYLYSVTLWLAQFFLEWCSKYIKKDEKRWEFKFKCSKIAVNIVMQYMTVVAVDQISLVQNSQNNTFETVKNTLYSSHMEKIAWNSNCLWKYISVGLFGTAGLALLNCTSNANNNSSIVHHKLFLML